MAENTLAQNIEQAIDDFANIKDAVENKGVTVPAGTPTSQYAEKISEIETGITPTGTVNISQNGTVDVTQYAIASVNVSGGSDATLISLINRSITSIDIPNDVTAVEGYVFAGCAYLTSVTFPSNLGYIADYAFYACGGLQSPTFPSSITLIGGFSFEECSNLTTIDLSHTRVEIIGHSAFKSCIRLTTVYLPTTLQEIEMWAFSGSALTDIYYTGTQAEWEEIYIDTEAIPSGVTIHYNYSPG